MMKMRIPAWLPMGDVRLAARNIFRQKARTALTLSIIATGVAGLILSGGFVSASLDTLRESTIHAQLGHLQIYKKGYFLEGKRSPYRYLIEHPDDILRRVAAVGEVKRAMGRLSFAGIVNNGRSDYAIIAEGIDVAQEAALGTQLHIVEGRPLATTDHFGMLVGQGVARGAALHPGSVVNVLVNTEEGALNSLEFTVVGVFQTFSKDYDARAIRVALADAQELEASKAINAVIVELDRTERTETVAAVIGPDLAAQGYEVKTWRDLADFYEQTAALFRQQFAFLQAIILLSVLLSVANSVNMTIFERTGEFGTLMALGTRRAPIFRLVLTENTIVGVIGSALGVVLGMLLAGVINSLHITLPPPPSSDSGYFARIHLELATVAASFLVGLIAPPLMALLPARRISRIAVVDALRMN